MGAYTHTGDYEAIKSLGLNPDFRGREPWESIGSVVVSEGEPEKGKPATEVEVEVYCAPAMFWRFTIHRPQEYKKNGTWIYEPREVLQVSTGSGAFVDYWPMAKAVAERMLCCKSFGLEDGPADRARSKGGD